MRAGGGVDCPTKVLRGGRCCRQGGGGWGNVGGAHRCFVHCTV